MENKKVTAGRDYLGGFAPQFAALNCDAEPFDVFEQLAVMPFIRKTYPLNLTLTIQYLDKCFFAHVQLRRCQYL